MCTTPACPSPDLDAQRAWLPAGTRLHEVVEEFQLDEPAVRTVVLRSAPVCAWNSSNGPARPDTGLMPIRWTPRALWGFGHWAVSVRDLDAAFDAIVAAGGVAVWPRLTRCSRALVRLRQGPKATSSN